MARWVIGCLLVMVVIIGSCSDDELPPYATDLGSSDAVPPAGTDTTPPADGGLGDAGEGDGGVATCVEVVPGGLTNQVVFDDPSIVFEPQSAFARFRSDCVAPGRLQLALTEDLFCREGARELRVDLPGSATTGTTLGLGTGDDVEVTFRDDDGTVFSNRGDCAASSGTVRVDALDLTVAGRRQQIAIEAAQLFDCRVGGRDPITVTGDVDALLEQTFEQACPDP